MERGPRNPALLFTAFEPSADALAAPVIAELRRRKPELAVFALGGPAMAAAGAELLEATTQHAAMGLGALGQAWAHRRRLARLRAWLAEHPVAALVPVDSPAANWSICKLVRATNSGGPRARILHLVAPQLWAWAPWRIRRMKRLSDRVLCLLPFEPAWFEARGMPAGFVGHPLYSGQRLEVRGQEEGAAGTPSAADQAGPESAKGRIGYPSADLPATDGPKLALLPGSRASELRRNLPTLRRVWAELAGRHPNLVGVIAAPDAVAADALNRPFTAARNIIDDDFGVPWPPTGIHELGDPGDHDAWDRLHLAWGLTPRVLDWADLVLVKSGTSTLQVAAHRKPMVVFYNLPRWQWHLGGRWLVGTRTFALPNLIAEADGAGRIVPEFVPHFGQPAPLVAELERLMCDPAAAEAQRAALTRLAERYAGVDYASRAAGEILMMIGDAT